MHDAENRLSASNKAVALQRDLEGRASVVQATVNGGITSVVTATTYQVGTTVIDRVEQGNGNVFDRDFDADFDGYITGTHSSLSPAQQGPAATWARFGRGRHGWRRHRRECSCLQCLRLPCLSHQIDLRRVARSNFREKSDLVVVNRVS